MNALKFLMGWCACAKLLGHFSSQQEPNVSSSLFSSSTMKRELPNPGCVNKLPALWQSFPKATIKIAGGSEFSWWFHIQTPVDLTTCILSASCLERWAFFTIPTKSRGGKGLPDLSTVCWLQLNHLVSSQCALFSEVEQGKKTENRG